MHLQQVLNILVNGQGVDYVHSRDGLQQVQVKAPVVRQYISKPKGENVVGPMDVFASLTDYPGDGTASIGFWSVVNVLQYGKEVSFSQTEVEDPNTNCFVVCQY